MTGSSQGQGSEFGSGQLCLVGDTCMRMYGCSGCYARGPRHVASLVFTLGLVCLSLLASGCVARSAASSGLKHAAAAAEPLRLQARFVTNNTNWRPEATRLIKELEKCRDEVAPYWWIFVDEATYTQVLPMIDPALRKAAVLESHDVCVRAPKILMTLWLLTGRSPFKDLDDNAESWVTSLTPVLEGYRGFMEQSRDVPQSVIQEDGVREAVALLTTRYWSSACDYLERKFDFPGVFYTSAPVWLLNKPLQPEDGERLRREVEAWVDANLHRLVWDGSVGKYRSPDGRKIDGSVLSEAIKRARISQAWWLQYLQSRSQPAQERGEADSHRESNTVR